MLGGSGSRTGWAGTGATTFARATPRVSSARHTDGRAHTGAPALCHGHDTAGVAAPAGTAQLAVAPAAFAGGKSCFLSWGEESTGGFVASSGHNTDHGTGPQPDPMVAAGTATTR